MIDRKAAAGATWSLFFCVVRRCPTEQQAIYDAVVSLVALTLSIPYVKPILVLLVLAWFLGWVGTQSTAEGAE